MVVKAAKNRYYHFSLHCGQIIKKGRKSTRYCVFSAVFIFLEHFLFFEWNTSLVRTRSRVQIPLSAPQENHKILWFFLYFCRCFTQLRKNRKSIANTVANTFCYFFDFHPDLLQEFEKPFFGLPKTLKNCLFRVR